MIVGTLFSVVYELFKGCWFAMSHVHVLKKLPYCFLDFFLCPTDKYMFKVNNNKK